MVRLAACLTGVSAAAVAAAPWHGVSLAPAAAGAALMATATVLGGRSAEAVSRAAGTSGACLVALAQLLSGGGVHHALSGGDAWRAAVTASALFAFLTLLDQANVPGPTPGTAVLVGAPAATAGVAVVAWLGSGYRWSSWVAACAVIAATAAIVWVRPASPRQQG